jgi:hypothetical protein
MAEYEMKDNTFSLFRNEKKEKETQPDYSGDIMWKGEKLRLSAWLNETKAGKKYIKGTVSEPYEGGKSNKKQSEDF